MTICMVYSSALPSKLVPMAETDTLLNTASPILNKWTFSQDEENGNTIEVPAVKNGNSSPRPALKKAESVEVVDCTFYL